MRSSGTSIQTRKVEQVCNTPVSVDSGLVVSKLAFGSMTFGSGSGPFAAVHKVNQPPRTISYARDRRRHQLLQLGGRVRGRGIGAAARQSNRAEAPRSRDRDQGRQPNGVLADRVGAIAPARARGRGGKPRAARHGLHRRIPRPQGRRPHADRRDDRGARRPRAPRHGPLRRLLELARMDGAKAVACNARTAASAFRAAEMYYSLLGRGPRARGAAVLSWMRVSASWHGARSQEDS
jgi:hypothetical protein